MLEAVSYIATPILHDVIVSPSTIAEVFSKLGMAIGLGAAGVEIRLRILCHCVGHCEQLIVKHP